MKIFAISDLHLSSAVEKPMNIFGTSWDNHFQKIREDWTSKVGENDLVLLGGDMSWGMTIEQAKPDYTLISGLNGRKIVVKGNHDLYWNSLIKMQQNFPEFDFLQNNAFRVVASSDIPSETASCLTHSTRGAVIAGTRGWNLPSNNTDSSDLKIYNRELIRLELSLMQAQKIRQDKDILIVMLHYPPFDANYADTEITSMLERYKADYVLYGHLHGKNVRVKPRVEKNGICYLLTSCDLIDCKLVKICQI